MDRFSKVVGVLGSIAAATVLSFGAGAGTHSKEEQQPYTTWSAYLGNPDSSHYSALTQIDRSNVNQLRIAWSYKTGDEHPYEFNPIIVGRTIYVLAKHNSLVALDAATGKELWTYHSSFATDIEMHRGINFWQSKDGSEQRLLLPIANHLEAIDARTGKLILSFGDNGRVDLREGLGRDPQKMAQIQSGTPGRVFDNLLILGSATGEEYGSPPGDIRAYDVHTGKMAWIFHTMPHPGEFGYNTWPKDTWKYEGGTNCWGEMSLDEKRGILYIPTGAPTYDFYGADRVGNDLFADSLLALDARTGKLIWYYQLVHHDLWDYDATAAPQLLDIEQNGGKIPIVAQATKNGFVYVFNRVTGKPIWPIEERPTPKSNMPGEVTSPTQPFPTKPLPFARQSFTVADLNQDFLTPEQYAAWKVRLEKAVNHGLFTPPEQTDTVEMPGNHGGTNWGMTAANPTNGTLYVMSMDIPAILKDEHRLPPNLWDIPTDVSPAQQGKAIYTLYCERCHGADRSGGSGSPSLVNAPSVYGVETIQEIVRNGRGEMPGFNELTDQHIKNLILYLGNPASAPEPFVQHTSPSSEANSSDTPVRYWSGYNLETEIIKPPFSTLTAYNLNDGSTKWQVPVGDAPPAEQKGIKDAGVMMPRNGPVVTAGGVIFVATKYEGKLHAYDQQTGKEVWSVDLPAAAEGVPSVYEVDGREFIVICATTGKYAGIPHDGPSPMGAGVDRSYIAFALPDTQTAKR